MSELRINNKLFILSDTHFGHDNIIKYQQRPKNHEIIMLSEWVRAVTDDDQILHMGDVFLGRGGNPKRWSDVLARMPGEKFLIKGNHDEIDNELYLKAGFTIVPEFIDRGVAFTHRPITNKFPVGSNVVPDKEMTGPRIDALRAKQDEIGWHTNIHGHIHANPHHQEDGSYDPTKTYINVCVEVMDYKPIHLGNLMPR